MGLVPYELLLIHFFQKVIKLGLGTMVPIIYDPVHLDQHFFVEHSQMRMIIVSILIQMDRAIFILFALMVIVKHHGRLEVEVRAVDLKVYSCHWQEKLLLLMQQQVGEYGPHHKTIAFQLE